MITIIKGNDKIVCTKGTFEEQYKSLGYQIASDDKEATEKVASVFNKDEKKKEKKSKISQEDNKDNEEINEKYGLKKTTKKGK